MLLAAPPGHVHCSLAVLIADTYYASNALHAVTEGLARAVCLD